MCDNRSPESQHKFSTIRRNKGRRLKKGNLTYEPTNESTVFYGIMFGDNIIDDAQRQVTVNLKQ